MPPIVDCQDGAAAAIVCNAQGLKRLQRARAVRLHASVLRTATDRPADRYDQHL